MNNFNYCSKMFQQKQKESAGYFEDIKQQVETFNSNHYTLSLHNPSHIPNHSKHLSEKQKIGLLLSNNLKEIYYSPTVTKSNYFYHGKILKVGSVTFRSNYQCGNIGTVDLIGINLYKISLDYQTNSSRGNSWFYFTVEGAKGEVEFIIEGFTKKKSLYNNEMKICYRDSKESNKWRRGCTNISYKCSDQEYQNPTYELHFKYFFKTNENSSIEFAYAFPYSFNRLQNFINTLLKIKVQTLGKTYDGKSIPMILIGNHDSKEVIIISSRVHPGETCSSFIAEGFIKELLSNTQHAISLREKYLFKIVPMINIDGVIKGNYRFSSIGVDLNRKWKQPTETYHPEIFYLKEMILRENKERKVIMYIDMHGHSRKKNVFFYGCSTITNDEQPNQAKSFPFLMSKIHEPYNFYDCSFNIEKEKEGTARVTLWKELRIHEVFTLQASMCSSQSGKNYLQSDYQKIGRKLCEGICIYFINNQEIKSQIMKKMQTFKEKVIRELISDPFLLKIGNEEDGGSESQPQKGQNNDKQKGSKESKKKDPSKNVGYNIHSNKKKSFKQKSETALFLEDSQLIKQKQILQFLFENPPKNATIQKSNPVTAMKNSRFGSISKNQYYKTAIKSITYDQSEYIINDKYFEKNKMNLLMNWEGAQYRRVRKTAEQSWKKDSIQDVELKGISTKKIEIQRNKALIPKLAIKNKLKRTSAQIYAKKALRMQQIQVLQRDRFNVLCRGRHISM